MAITVVVPEPFSGEGSVDVDSWFRRFEYCTAANGWDGEKHDWQNFQRFCKV